MPSEVGKRRFRAGIMSRTFRWTKILILPLTLHELLLHSMPQLSTCKIRVFVTFSCAAEINMSKNVCGDTRVMEVL